MSDHELFVRFDDETNTFVPRRLRITFTNFDETRVKFDDSSAYWRAFVKDWWHHDNYSDAPLLLTNAQQARLDDVNAQGITTEYVNDVADYVRWGTVRQSIDEPYLSTLVGTQTVLEAELEKTRHGLRRKLEAHRYRVEVGGTALADGTAVPTDRGSQGQLANAYSTLKDGLRDTIDWKGPDGWVTLTPTEVTSLATASATHVQRCFTAEKRVDQQLTGKTDITALMDFDVIAAFDNERTALDA